MKKIQNIQETILTVIVTLFLVILLSNNDSLANNISNTVKTSLVDAAITAKIKTALSDNPITRDSTIYVSTKNGVVTLTGKVPTSTAGNQAIYIAKSTEGVKYVQANRLYVDYSKQPLTDSYITTKVKSLLAKEKLLSDSDIPLIDIKVETQNGVVYLTGHVSTEKQKMAAINAAKSIKEVKKVVPYIVIDTHS